jgi:hypothetical protein
MRHPIALITVLGLLAGCGLSGTAPQVGKDPGSVRGFSQVTTDDTDLGGRIGAFNMTANRLKAEAIAQTAETMLFPAKTGKVTVRPGALSGAAKVKGRFMMPARTGGMIPGANATVKLLSGGREIGSAQVGLDGAFEIAAPAGGAAELRFELSNRYWKLSRYSWQGPKLESLSGVVDAGTTQLDAKTANGEAAYIHEIYNRSLALFAREGISLDWWNRQLDTVWPANGNYYSWGTVNLSNAEWWDVNGHEIGHALHDLGINGRMGGGQHKIDECYTSNLAWSEGFASFFSAAVSLERDDADAKFEYMVPRRAPLRFENMPGDVCGGPTNEWWTTATLWDLYDRHNEKDDQVSLEFSQIWGALAKNNGKKPVGSMVDAYVLIKERVEPAQHASLQRLMAFNGMPLAAMLAQR